MAAKAVAGSRRLPWLAIILGGVGSAILLGLGTWQMQRLAWKEALIATISERMRARPLPLADIEAKFAVEGNVDYWPVTASGRFMHEGERHFFATHEGQSGFFVYTPLFLADGRVIFVNRGFVSYDLKGAEKRLAGQVAGAVKVTGLARNALVEKPSSMLPDNDPGDNIFYWKDISAMTASGGLPTGTPVVPFFLDVDKTPNPGGWPVGGVTLIEQPNSHLQYAITWYGLAAALAGVMGALFWRRRH